MNSFQKLENIFKEFPGIGPRQAKRFVYFLLLKQENYRKDLIKLVEILGKENKKCLDCQRFFAFSERAKIEDLCLVCKDPKREKSKVLILSKDVDFENIEKSKAWSGLYYILGRNLRILEKFPEKTLSLTNLKKFLIKNKAQELVFGLSVNPEGEKTKNWISGELEEFFKKNKIKTLEMARGLSRGLELEYSDPETIKAALKNRT